MAAFYKNEMFPNKFNQIKISDVLIQCTAFCVFNIYIFVYVWFKFFDENIFLRALTQNEFDKKIKFGKQDAINTFIQKKTF